MYVCSSCVARSCVSPTTLWFQPNCSSTLFPQLPFLFRTLRLPPESFPSAYELALSCPIFKNKNLEASNIESLTPRHLSLGTHPHLPPCTLLPVSSQLLCSRLVTWLLPGLQRTDAWCPCPLLSDLAVCTDWL